MIEKIILKKSAVENKIPTTEQLDYGEIALNFNTMNPFISFKDTADGIRQIKDYSNEIQNINGSLTDAKNEINYLRPLVTDNHTNLMFLRGDFEDFKADNTNTINVLDRNVSQNSSEIATLSTSVDKKVDKTDIVQSTGTSETAVMSQKAVSDALSNVYTKAESDARYLRGEVLYEDYYYPNMSPTTDTTRFTDSTEILQPTKFIGQYTDTSGQTYNCVFECDSFPDWFDFAEGACNPYGNGISTAIPFFKNYTINDGELVYDFNSLQNAANIAKKLPHFTNYVGLKKIDDNHFNLYTAKNGAYEFTSIDKDNVDCSLFGLGPCVNTLTYDIDDCKMVRVSLIGNFQQPSRYATIISSGSDISIKGHIVRQQLYGNEYVDLEIDKLNKRYRQIGAGYSMWYRISHTQNWDKATQESFYSQCTSRWWDILNGLNFGVCNVGGKLLFSFNGYFNPSNRLIMGCKIKIEKLA